MSKLTDYLAIAFVFSLMLFLVVSIISDLVCLGIWVVNWMTWLVNQSP